MKKHISTVILIIVFLIGLSLLLYPAFSDWWNSMHQSRAIAGYAEMVAGLDEDKYAELWDDAQAFNAEVNSRPNAYVLSDEQEAKYNELLNVGGNGVMGYIEISKIGVSLPIYHGVDEAVLQVAVGHIDWSSLPIGGEGSHAVLSGHRGLPSAKLFTDLDRLEVGDTFVMRILDEVLTYEVDAINIVTPDDTSHLHPVNGKDYCTLVTCTPYGINSHRLLVRGHRIENAKEARIVRITADAVQIKPIIVTPIVAAPILFVMMLILLFKPTKKKK